MREPDSQTATMRLLSLQCELLMQIGSSLDLDDMLRSFLVALTRRLQAAASQVWLKVPNGESSELRRFGYPAGSVAEWLSDDQVTSTLGAYCQDVAALPKDVVCACGDRVHVLAVGDLGCLFIQSPVEAVPETVFVALKAIMPRLAVACRACLNHASNLELLELTRSQNVALEEARRRQEQDERMRSEFLAAISHEMRTPLNCIIGFGELLKLELDNGELADYARNIHAAGSQLNAIFRDLLDAAKLDAHRLKLYPESIEIAPLVDELAAHFSVQARHKKLSFNVHVDQDLPATLTADPVRLRQILHNLLANAVKYTEHGGLSLRLARHQEQHLAFSIADTGIGISPDAQSMVFERFRQLSHMGRRPHEGTGLGLSIARDLAGLMGGTIQLESVPGAGSTFTLLLPAAEQQVGLVRGPTFS